LREARFGKQAERHQSRRDFRHAETPSNAGDLVARSTLPYRDGPVGGKNGPRPPRGGGRRLSRALAVGSAFAPRGRMHGHDEKPKRARSPAEGEPYVEFPLSTLCRPCRSAL
jgi:hypothetical protein